MSIGRWPGPRQGAANWLLSSQEGKGRRAVPQGASGQSSRWPETQERPGQPPCSSALGGGPCGAGEAGRSWQLPRAQKILALLSSFSLNWKDHISPGPTLWAVQVHPSKARWWWGGCSLTSCAFPAWARGPGGRAGLSAALAGRLFPEGAAPGPRRLGTSTHSTPDFPEASLSLSWGPCSDGGLGVGGGPPPSPPPRLRAW